MTGGKLGENVLGKSGGRVTATVPALARVNKDPNKDPKRRKEVNSKCMIFEACSLFVGRPEKVMAASSKCMISRSGCVSPNFM